MPFIKFNRSGKTIEAEMTDTLTSIEQAIKEKGTSACWRARPKGYYWGASKSVKTKAQKVRDLCNGSNKTGWIFNRGKDIVLYSLVFCLVVFTTIKLKAAFEDTESTKENNNISVVSMSWYI